MGTKTVVALLAVASLPWLAACQPRQPGSATAPSRAIEADIAAARRAGPSAASPLSPPAGGALAAGRAPQASAPPAAASAEIAPASTAAGLAGPGDAGIGRRFALDNCRPCHVVAANQGSPVRFANAPDFQKIANAPQTTPLSLNVWLTNPHPTMPTLRLTPEEASNVIAYIMSLRR